MADTPSPISEVDDAEQIRVVLLASGQPVHAPLQKTVEAGALGRLLPAGGEEGQVLTKASSTDADAVWSSAIGIHSWVNFNGTGTPAIRDDSNVDSIVDNGTGDYTVKYASSVGTGASVTVTPGDTGTPGAYLASIYDNSTTYVSFTIYNLSGSAVDVDTINVQTFGRLFNFLSLEGDEQDDGLDKISLEGDAAPGVLLLTPPAI